MMLKRIVMQVSGKMVSLFTRLWVWVETRLLKPVSSWLVKFIHKFLSAINLQNRFAQMVSSFKAYHASQTIVEQSTKQERSTAKPKATPTGSQPQTTARRTRRPARPTRKKGS